MIRRAVLVAVPLGLALATPALSEGIFEALFGLRPEPPPQYYAPAPRYMTPDGYAPRRYVRRSEPRPRMRHARLSGEKLNGPVRFESPLIAKPRPMGEVDNPLPKLLVDSTLRNGDIVVFPDSPRVFKGSAGDKHKLTDFVAVSQKSVGSSTRKLLAAMKIGPNDAWSTDIAMQGKKIASTDVETTGSIKKNRRNR